MSKRIFAKARRKRLEELRTDQRLLQGSLEESNDLDAIRKQRRAQLQERLNQPDEESGTTPVPEAPVVGASGR